MARNYTPVWVTETKTGLVIRIPKTITSDKTRMKVYPGRNVRYAVAVPINVARLTVTVAGHEKAQLAKIHPITIRLEDMPT